MKADVSVRSSDEIADAIRAFTDAQWVRLRTVAEKYSESTRDFAPSKPKSFCRKPSAGRSRRIDVALRT